jgi:hypothetical protein
VRTTLSLDDDVVAQLTELRSRHDRPFKQLINDVLRAGLAQLERAEPVRCGPYTLSVSLGKSRLPDVDDISDVLALVEGESHL